MKPTYVLMAIAATALAACSNQQLYDGIQQNRIQHCERYPDSQYAQCVAQYQKDYREYERERQELLNESGN
ncbi:hypothetical protein GNX18_15610 [Microbulbifer sp. SH-1]|uniref:hypothetical protein n=1 Tax=Microbulbifer sp. SH-1 TaxID=2681547 RepID=UPI00140B5F4D|nr:hypothetical protein [Microbulbifer sp. SH-1]QIL91040.1 hypothetical protein GNX18_15610 [Microbulbifer sp. SH-1]